MKEKKILFKGTAAVNKEKKVMKKTSFIKARKEWNFKDKECCTETEWSVLFGSEN